MPAVSPSLRRRRPPRAPTAIPTGVAAAFFAVALWSCDRGEFFGPPETTTFDVSLSGRIVDGRDLREPGVAGQVAVMAPDGVTPVLVDDDHIIDTDAEGRFSATFQADLTEPTLVLEASASAPLLTGRHAVAIDAGPVDVSLFLSSTLLSGTVLGPDGRPAVVDIWIMRDDGSGNFVPYEITGGRDFIPPVPETGVNFGMDSDVLGGYSIPIRVPGAAFRLVFVVDTNTDAFSSFLTDVFVTGGIENRVPTITLESVSAPSSSSTAGGP